MTRDPDLKRLRGYFESRDELNDLDDRMKRRINVATALLGIGTVIVIFWALCYLVITALYSSW
jgi:hypothetical protein